MKKEEFITELELESLEITEELEQGLPFVSIDELDIDAEEDRVEDFWLPPEKPLRF